MTPTHKAGRSTRRRLTRERHPHLRPSGGEAEARPPWAAAAVKALSAPASPQVRGRHAGDPDPEEAEALKAAAPKVEPDTSLLRPRIWWEVDWTLVVVFVLVFAAVSVVFWAIRNTGQLDETSFIEHRPMHRPMHHTVHHLRPRQEVEQWPGGHPVRRPTLDSSLPLPE